MAKYKFDHIHVMSTDPEKTFEFYKNAFGATLVEKVDMGKGRYMLNVDLGGVTMLISKTDDEKKGRIRAFRDENPPIAKSRR